MLYSTLSQFDQSEQWKIPLAVKIEAYARHAATLAGSLHPLARRPQFNRLFCTPAHDVLIEIGRNIMKYLLPEGVLLGEAGELKDRIGTSQQFYLDILFHLGQLDAQAYIKQHARPIDSTNPDDLRGIAIFALAEPDAFCG